MRTIRHHLPLLPAALVAAALAPGAAAAAPTVTGQFRLSERPHQLTQGPDGNVWVALEGTTRNDLAKVAPDGTVTEYDVAALRSPFGIATGPDGNLWLTQTGEVVRLSPADPVGSARVFAAPAIAGAQEIVAGPDGNLWTASVDNALQITPSGTVRPFLVSRMRARGIANTGDGTLAIADFGGAPGEGRVVRLTTDGRATFVPTGGQLIDVAAGAGGALGYTNPLGTPQQVGRIAPGAATAQPTDVPLTDPFGITFGADGAWWVANFSRDAITRLAPDGTVTPLSGFGAGSGPRWITAGPGNTLWVALEAGSAVARVSGVEPPARTGGGGTGGGGTGGGQRPAGDTTAPKLSKARVVLKRTRHGARAQLRFTLSERATATIRLERRLPGRRLGGKCVKPAAGRAVAKTRRCLRWVRVGAKPAPRTLTAGAVRVGLASGRVLAPSRYRVTVTLRDDAGNRAAPRTVRFAVTERSAR
jgi:virginiamycin B lyase